MSDPDKQKAPQDNRAKRILIYAVGVIVIFLLGLVPMGFIAHSRAVDVDKAQADLRACNMQGHLASAATDARLGNYEPARQSASSFFAGLREEMDRGNDSAFTQSQRDRLQAFLAPRDELITLLARGDPASADRLAQLYIAFRKALQ